MQSFREFEAGPDPFGRKFQAQFKWLQTAISIRHSDTVDVKFILVDPDGVKKALDHGASLVHECPGIRRQEHRAPFSGDFAHGFERQIIPSDVKCVQESPLSGLLSHCHTKCCEIFLWQRGNFHV